VVGTAWVAGNEIDALVVGTNVGIEKVLEVAGKLTLVVGADELLHLGALLVSR